jgi:uncharacterized protein
MPPSEATMAVLKKRGYLTEMSVEAETAWVSKVAITMHQYNTQGMPAYIFMPTYKG